jgi:hypothetical protein
MSRSTKVWLVVAALFAAVNAWGAWYAAARAETTHAGVHVALLLPTMYAIWRLAQRRVPAY